MPIRINLLAEAQAAEEQRRRDPVKRAVLVAICLVLLVLVWGGSLQVKLMSYKARLNGLEAKLNSQTNSFQQIQSNQAKLNVINQKLGALHQLATNRFLIANVLNSLQQSTLEGIQLMRLRTEQTFLFTDEVKPEFLAFIRSFRPMPRMGTVDDVANAAQYLVSDLAGFVSGQHLLVTGGAPA